MLAPSAAGGAFCAAGPPGESDAFCASAPKGALAQNASAIAAAPIILIRAADQPADRVGPGRAVTTCLI